MNIKQLFRNKIFTNMRWLVSGRILQMAIALVINMVTARYLGVNNYGIINYIAWELQKQWRRRLLLRSQECPERQRFVVRDMAMLCVAADL